MSFFIHLYLFFLGLHQNDPRLSDLFTALEKLGAVNEDIELASEEFLAVIAQVTKTNFSIIFLSC